MPGHLTIDRERAGAGSRATREAAAHRAEPPAAACGIATTAVRGGRRPDPSSGAILAPICQSTTYVQEGVGRHRGHTYSRASNPTVSALEDALGALEAAATGRDAFATSYATGMAAVTGLFLSVLRAGDHAVLSSVLYGGTVRLAEQVLRPLGIDVTYADAADLAALDAAITPRTRLVFIETPANPTLVLTDVDGAAALTRRRGVLLAVDNTFLTPVILRPLDLGADVSVYSTTKYIEGHNATVGGALVTRDPALRDRLRLIRKTLGSIQSPFDAWLTVKGIKTLPLRLRQHSAGALAVAEHLRSHPRVARVTYPGLDTFPQHDLARRQHRTAAGEVLHGGIVSFEVRGGARAGRVLMESLALCSLAENLGAAETLVTHPATMTHADVPPDQRAAGGITDGLVRLSVGLEEPRDIIADLDRALEIAAAAPPPTRAGGRAARRARLSA